MGKRDYAIEYLRFLATLGIAVYHFEWIYIGYPIFFEHFYILVEFFFVLSGFFLARNVINKKEKKDFDSIFYIKNEIKKLWPPYLIGFFFSFYVYCIKNPNANALEVLFNAKWELFMLQICGFENDSVIINGVTAYVSALLFSSLIVYYLLDNHMKIFYSLLGILCPFLFYSHIINTYGNLSQWMGFESYFCIGILRGLAGMCLGAEVYIIVLPYIKNIKQTVLYFLALLSIIIISFLVIFRNYISFKDEIMYPYIFGILIASVFAMEKKNRVKIISYIGNYLGKISYFTYLLHYGVCMLLVEYKMPYAKALIIYLGIILIFSIVVDKILVCLIKIITKNKKIDKIRLNMTQK